MQCFENIDNVGVELSVLTTLYFAALNKQVPAHLAKTQGTCKLNSSKQHY